MNRRELLKRAAAIGLAVAIPDAAQRFVIQLDRTMIPGQPAGLLPMVRDLSDIPNHLVAVALRNTANDDWERIGQPSQIEYVTWFSVNNTGPADGLGFWVGFGEDVT